MGWFPQSAQYILLRNGAEDHCFHHRHPDFALCFLQPHSPSLRVDHDCVRLVDHAGDESLSVMRSADLGNLDDVSARIGPVQVSRHPVHSDPARHLQIRNLTTVKKKKKSHLENSLDLLRPCPVCARSPPRWSPWSRSVSDYDCCWVRERRRANHRKKCALCASSSSICDLS